MPSGVYERKTLTDKQLKSMRENIKKATIVASNTPKSSKQLEVSKRVVKIAQEVAHKLPRSNKQIQVINKWNRKGTEVSAKSPRTEKQLVNCGVGKWKRGWYRGYFFQSSWELAFIVYHLDHNISFERNHKAFTYEFEGMMRRFYPDFFKNGSYVEIKGFRSKKTDEKIRQFPEKIVVLYEMDIFPYIEYCEEKYGKNFVDVLMEKK